MDLWMIILSLIAGILFIYLLSAWNFNRFKNLGIPYVKPIPIFGNLAGLLFRVKSLVDVIEETYKSHPDAKYVGFYEFSTPIIMLRDPELIKSIVIKNFDSFPNHRKFVNTQTEPLFKNNLFALEDNTWREMRALLSPAFTSSKMKLMFKIMSDCGAAFSDQLSKLDPNPEKLDVKETFGRYTLDVIASTAFGLTVNSMEDRDNEFYKMGRRAANFSGARMLKILILQSFPWLGKILDVKILDSDVSKFIMDVIASTISTRQERGIVRPDMIQLMMQAKEKSNLSPEDMAAQAFIFFIAGFESPATTMSFAAYELALNQDVQKKLQAEIDDVLKNGNGEVSYEDLNAMKYLDAVVSETLRKFPPAASMDRTTSKSFVLPPALPGLEPLTIEPGQVIWLPCYSLHHDPKYFPNPKKFDPERFNGENRAAIDPSTYFPFGLGPRICIANRFALMEVKLVLFHVLAKCNLLPTPKAKPEIVLGKGNFILMPEDGFWLRVEPRK